MTTPEDPTAEAVNPDQMLKDGNITVEQWREMMGIVWGAEQHGEPDNGRATMTYMGHIFDLQDPTTWVFDIRDIARALSNITRFGGHTYHSLSVAEHSINVCLWLANQGYSAEVQKLGLLHEVGEVYMGDIPAPWKKYVTIGGRPFKDIEIDIEVAYFDQENLADCYIHCWDFVKEADTAVYFLERAARPDPGSGKFTSLQWHDLFMKTYEMLNMKILKEKLDQQDETQL